MEDVNLIWDEEAQMYEDADNPDTWWQLVEFNDDTYDCTVCEFPIDPGFHYVDLDDGSYNAHSWCVSVKKDKVTQC